MKIRYIKALMTMILIASCLIMFPTSQAVTADKPLTKKSSSEKDVIQAVGVSAPNQDKYSAMTSAKAIAQANLLSMIQSTYIDRIVKSKGNEITEETIRTRVQGVIVGAFSCGATYHADQGYAEVCLEIKLNGESGLYEALYSPISKNTNGLQESTNGQ
jgi:hypothetical protein